MRRNKFDLSISNKSFHYSTSKTKLPLPLNCVANLKTTQKMLTSQGLSACFRHTYFLRAD